MRHSRANSHGGSGQPERYSAEWDESKHPRDEDGKFSKLYHVVRGDWDGGPIESFRDRHPEWSDEVAEAISEAWPDVDPWAYYSQEAGHIHLHDTLELAREFAEEFGGQILEVDADGLDVGVGQEYPHPIVRDAIDPSRIRATKAGGGGSTADRSRAVT